MTQEILLQQIKKAVETVSPGSKVLLYGSRARGTAHTLSDWDILVLVDGTLSLPQEQNLRRSVYEVEWLTGEVISLMVRSVHDWESERTRITPLYQAIAREAVAA